MRPHLRAAFAASFALLVSSPACGGSTASGSGSYEPGPMPPGGTFTGVWFSPQYGEMHMVQSGANVVGLYRKDERRGRIQGTASGRILRFQWEERRELVGGRPTVTRGRGVFRYVVGADGRHNLLGEWGLDDQETGGGPWNAYRLRNRRPNINPDGSARDDSDGDGPSDWDREASGQTGSSSPGSDDGLGGLDL
ncbi:MAG: hypothetical protein NZ898_03565 [Myxococcota bacterium]|nr:hypothetical protein [Myxococcota bacterium]MDW8361186.1 hypothetical protein [Myxococcales bacterium]